MSTERALPWLLLLYCGASILHFVHNAEYVADYPNLPLWISRSSIYIAWLTIFSVGLCGYLLYRGRHALPGLILLAVYAALGLDGLLHYSRAPMAAHTAAMNATIWIEVVTASIALAAVLLTMRTGAVHRVTLMHPALQAAFEAVFRSAQDAFAAGNLPVAFAYFERAHILGQWYVGPHVRTHVGMLRIGWRRRDLREIVGQLIRIPGGMIGSAVGRVPSGNTGGANVGAFRSLPIPAELGDFLELDSRSRSTGRDRMDPAP